MSPNLATLLRKSSLPEISAIGQFYRDATARPGGAVKERKQGAAPHFDQFSLRH
ncbi:hypothetical protein ASPBRDRAFT_674135 [Aspergillus brasiliensis CBS 101740]|uniref:Uncharacterized protein n=1 Tax=Aspergillus brasiliensis (strain CBS 101740 / IMI 381727 / IBT 21946) TaxID=767769 RepID=A0A1L9UIX9_ASPBC|nr:hypothetical protein ASPBRDRAFT_674135 [Aspergillus brasiliensis CBS 101740]